MSRNPSLLSRAPHARARVRFACAALLAVCAVSLTACGPGGPKRKTDDGGGNNDNGNSHSPGIALVAGRVADVGFNNANGTNALFRTPRGIAIDAGGNLYVADQQNFVIRKIATDGTVTTFAGNAGQSIAHDGTGTGAGFVSPTAMAIDASGNLFVTDGYAIRKITPAAVVTTLTTLPSGSGFGSSVQFQPAGIAVDASGNLFVTTSVDTRRLTVSNDRVTNITTMENGPAFDYGLGVDALAPRGIAVDASGTAYVADLGNTISYAKSNATSFARFAGQQGSSGTADGNTSQVRFRQVVALTTTKDGTLYAADAQSNTIRKITSGAVTSTVAGRAGSTTLATGSLQQGSLASVAGITNDGNGNLYVTTGNAVVRITLP